MIAATSDEPDLHQQQLINNDDECDSEQSYSVLAAIFGQERAYSLRQFGQRLAAVEDRLEKEYMEELTDQNLGQEQSGGSDVQQSGQINPVVSDPAIIVPRRDSSSPEEADYRSSFSEMPEKANKIFSRPAGATAAANSGNLVESRARLLGQPKRISKVKQYETGSRTVNASTVQSFSRNHHPSSRKSGGADGSSNGLA